MSKPELRLVTMPSDTRNPRALSPLDWASFAFAALALFLAPLVAGAFTTPAPGLMPYAVGVSLVIGLSGAAAAIAVVREWLRPVAVGAIPGLTGSLLLLGVWATLSLVRESALGYGLNGLAALFSALLLGGLISRLTRDKKALSALLMLLIGTGSLVAALTIREYIPMARLQFGYRAFGGFMTPDFLAGCLLLILPVTLAAFAAANDSSAQILLGIGTGLQTAALLMTGSRAGVLALGVALAVWLMLSFWSGAAQKRGRQIAAGFTILLVCGFLGAGPLRARLTGKSGNTSLASVRSASDAQAHSGAFRKQTWIGTVRMVKANPLLGTGIGTYEIAYPRYSLVAFTSHAHNSYLQWMAETGVPGAVFLLIALAAVAAFALNVLNLGRSSRADFADKEEDLIGIPLLAAPRLVLTGLLAAILAAMVKSFIDSDWYIVANLVTLAAVLALTVGLARDLAPLATQRPRPLSKAMLAAGGLLAIFLLWSGITTGTARYDLTTVKEAQQTLPANDAENILQSAITADPLDPEPRLQLALVQQANGQNDAALATLNDTVKIAPMGKTYYRLARFYTQTNRDARAIDAYAQAQNREPRNVQNLRALADTLARTGKNSEAVLVYRAIADLQNSDFGKIRAIPEMIEPEFVWAHLGLAQIATSAQNWTDADTEYERALELLRIYWHDRKNGYYDSLAPDRRDALTNAYENALKQRSDVLTHRNTPDAAAQKAALTAELAIFEQEKAADAVAVPTNPETGTTQ